MVSVLHGVRFPSTAARIVSSFLMQAVSATFFGLPAAKQMRRKMTIAIRVKSGAAE